MLLGSVLALAACHIANAKAASADCGFTRDNLHIPSESSIVFLHFLSLEYETFSCHHVNAKLLFEDQYDACEF